jgi:hypothetical protein
MLARVLYIFNMEPLGSQVFMNCSFVNTDLLFVLYSRSARLVDATGGAYRMGLRSFRMICVRYAASRAGRDSNKDFRIEDLDRGGDREQSAWRVLSENVEVDASSSSNTLISWRLFGPMNGYVSVNCSPQVKYSVRYLGI